MEILIRHRNFFDGFDQTFNIDFVEWSETVSLGLSHYCRAMDRGMMT